MEYATLGGAAAAQLNRTPELGRLKSASERIDSATNSISNFLDRFNGPQPPRAGNQGAPSGGSYRNDIDTLFIVVDRLEQTVAALSDIG
jgi:hypothetical protein